MTDYVFGGSVVELDARRDDRNVALRRARSALESIPGVTVEELWVMPPGPVTEEQVARVLRLIDAEREKS